MTEGFFDEMSDQSEIKSEIVSKYFGAWTRIMTTKSRSDKIAYVDLFAGPGRYNLEEAKSTPIKVLEQCIARDDLRNRMVTIFNDKNSDYAENLETNIEKIPGIGDLKFKPIVFNTQVGDELVSVFEKMNLVPCLSFVDPWGYKGLTSKLIWALIKDWGSDCIFFFNYNRINMGITNPIVVNHMNSIFGEDRADKLRSEVKSLNPIERELYILNALTESLSSKGANYVLPFRFIRANGERTSHYLIFVSKHTLGYTIMKNIMWKYSSEHEDGVASFSYVSVNNSQLSFLFEYSRPLDELGEELLNSFKGKTMRVVDIHDAHHVGRPFVMENYKEALRRLEQQGRIKVEPQNRPVRKGIKTFSEKVTVTFP